MYSLLIGLLMAIAKLHKADKLKRLSKQAFSYLISEGVRTTYVIYT